MAEEPTPPKSAPEPAPADQSATPASAAPSGDSAETAGSGQSVKLPDTTPLADGTAPTVLKAGETPKAAAKPSSSRLNNVYRRADILTSLLTAIGALAVAGVALGAYVFFTRPAANTNNLPKPTKLEQVEIDKLKAFFEGNSAGTPAEVLNITSPSFFKNRAAFASDIRVVGATQVTGPTALADLTVDKTSTLSVTNIRGQLSVSGPTTLQGQTTIANSLTVNGNVTSSGNGSFSGSLSAGVLNVRDISVAGALNINGHLNIGGQTPSVSPAAAAGAGASASIEGNDTAGTVTIQTGSVSPNADLGGSLVTITFRAPYARVPTVVITPNSRSGARLQPYIIKTATNFTISGSFDAKSNTSYSFDYWVAQ